MLWWAMWCILATFAYTWIQYNDQHVTVLRKHICFTYLPYYNAEPVQMLVPPIYVLRTAHTQRDACFTKAPSIHFVLTGV